MVTDIQLQDGSGNIIALGAREDDYVLESADWDVAKISTGTIYYYPTDGSERILHHDWQPRSVSIVGWVLGVDETGIETKCRRLESFIGLQDEIKILYNGYHLKFYPTKNVKFANTERENNEVLCKFLLEGIALDPMWYNDTVIESKNFHSEPKFFFPLYFNLKEPRVIFAEQRTSGTAANNSYATPMFHFPFILNYDIPSQVFGRLLKATSSMIYYDGVLSTGIVFRMTSTGEIRNLTIQLEHDGAISTFTLTGGHVEVADSRAFYFPLRFSPNIPSVVFMKPAEPTGGYPANTEIVIDTREGFWTVMVGTTDCVADVTEGSQWLRLRPGLNIFTFFYNGEGTLDVLIESKQNNLFEVQT